MRGASCSGEQLPGAPTPPFRVGYYVHHVGSGHRHRATTIAAELARREVEVTGLSSLERPADWTGAWLQLAADDEPEPTEDADPTARGRLHWAPLHHPGLRRRSAQVSQWIDAVAPALMICDVSQEVALLARLHGTPVVSVLLPGRRDDAAHVLGLETSADVVAFWPDTAQGMAPGLPASVASRLQTLGGLSRFPPADPGTRRPADLGPRSARSTRRALVLSGTGGGLAGADELFAVAALLRARDPGWSWRTLGPGAWSDDPFAELLAADVVLTHAGQNSLAEVAAARVPAVVVPAVRPHGEQHATAGALRDPRWPAVVAATDGVDDGALDRAAALDGTAWSGWVDGLAATRAADVVIARCRSGAAA